MNLLKEGVIFKNEQIWKNTNLDYYLCFGLGTWDPIVSTPEEIIQSETNQVRIPLSQTDITVQWNDLRGVDEVIIDKTFTPNEDIKFNRVFVMTDARERAKYEVTFNNFNTFTIDLPATNPFVIGDRLFYNNFFYEVTDSTALTVTVDPFPLAINLPNSGTGEIEDAKGILLVGSIVQEQYLIRSGTEANIILDGTTF